MFIKIKIVIINFLKILLKENNSFNVYFYPISFDLIIIS